MGMLCVTTDVTRLDKVRNEYIRGSVVAEVLSIKIVGKGLRWFGAYRKIRQGLHPGKEERLKSGDQETQRKNDEKGSKGSRV